MFGVTRFNIEIILLAFLLALLECVGEVSAQGRYGEEFPESMVRSLLSVKGNLYSGIDNYISVDYSITKDCDTFFLSVPRAAIIHDTLNRYLLIPERPGNARLTIYCLNSQDTIVLGYKYFIVRNLPDPCLEINGIRLSSPSSMSKSSLVAADSISVLFSDDIIGSESWFRVTDFTIGYNYGGFHVSHHNLSNKISLQTKQIISRIAPDREISISLNIESDGKIKKQLPIYRIRLY